MSDRGANMRSELKTAICDLGVEYEGSIITSAFGDEMIATLLRICPAFAAVLDGTHVIVPRNPTDTMLKAAGNEAAMTIYTLMIEAAQEPKA